MKKHELKTEKGEFVMVDLLEYPSTIYHTIYGVKLELICKLSEATEEDAKGVVRYHLKGGFLKCYYNYAKKYYSNSSYTALESLHSLLTSKGIDINNGNWYLFKKI